MEQQLTFHDKTMTIALSPSAINAANALTKPMVIEVQVYFSCLLAKRLAFYSEFEMQGVCKVDNKLFADIFAKSQTLLGNLSVRYNTIMTQTCPAEGDASAPPVTDFEIVNQKPYVPSWLNIDFANGIWSGEYGWQSSVKGYSNTKQIREMVQPG